jgi:hypothetical protein
VAEVFVEEATSLTLSAIMRVSSCRRVAVEFQRIEIALAADGHARGDLRFGLHFHFAQLAAQAPGCRKSRQRSPARPRFPSSSA